MHADIEILLMTAILFDWARLIKFFVFIFFFFFFFFTGSKIGMYDLLCMLTRLFEFYGDLNVNQLLQWTE